MKPEKLGAFFIVVAFGLVLTWLIFIPHIKYSGLIPSLNRKIEKVLKNPSLFETQVTQIFFWEYDKPGRAVPFEVDSQIISIIAEIKAQERKKDGFVNMKEPETFVLSFFTDNTFF